MMRKALLTVLVGLLLALFPTAVHADDPYATGQDAEHSMLWPLDSHEVVIEGPWNIWRMRPVAQFIDQRVPGLTIYAARGETVAAHPDAAVIHIVKVHNDGTSYAEITSPHERTIYLDTAGFESRPIDFQHTAGHELLHGLGLGHWAGFGLVGLGDSPPAMTRAQFTLPSPSEIQALVDQYNH